MHLSCVAALLPWLDPAMRLGGAAFLLAYGARSLWSAWHSTSVLRPEGAAKTAFGPTVATCLALTWLNPHVYLDTVVLLGTVSTRFAGAEAAFAAGATAASFTFFFSLGFGAGWLRPVFQRPASWRVLEAGIGLVMWLIALKLVMGS